MMRAGSDDEAYIYRRLIRYVNGYETSGRNIVQFHTVAAVGSLMPLQPAIIVAARKILMNKNSPGDKQRMQNATG